MLKLKRAYEPASREDGQRFLVERLWPRGVKKTSLHLDAWLKDIAPTGGLRQWFSHDPKKWDEFRQRYRAELERHPEVCDPILKAARVTPSPLFTVPTTVSTTMLSLCGITWKAGSEKKIGRLRTNQQLEVLRLSDRTSMSGAGRPSLHILSRMVQRRGYRRLLQGYERTIGRIHQSCGNKR